MSLPDQTGRVLVADVRHGGVADVRRGGVTDVRRGGAAFLAVLFLVAINLRAGIGSVPPLVPAIDAEFGLSGLALGALTTLPVLCLGLFAALAPRVLRRVGPDAAILASLGIMATGLLIRGAPGGIVALYGGTALAGAGVGLLGAIIPSVVRERAGGRVGTATGVYATAMAIGAAITIGAAVPLADGFASWRSSLSVWALPALVALMGWALLTHSREKAPAPARRKQRGTARLAPGNTVSWLVTGYVTVQSLLFFTELAWLAPSFAARGWSTAQAGAIAAVFTGAGIVATVTVPMLTDRVADRRWLVAGAAGCAVPALALIALSPGTATWPAVALLGFGQTAGFALGLVFLVVYTGTPAATAALTARAFTFGYTLAAGGPLALGALRDVFGGYRLPLLLLAAISAVPVVLALPLRHGRLVELRPLPPPPSSSALPLHRPMRPHPFLRSNSLLPSRPPPPRPAVQPGGRPMAGSSPGPR